jgi:hypothetical protein
MRLYGVKHHGVAIVCGGGPDLLADVAKARELRPEATLLGVNFSASVVPGIEHVWTQHIEIAPKIKVEAPHPVWVHSRPRSFQTKHGGAAWFLGVSKAQESEVDYLWPDLGWVGGSSGFAAALWARHGMGFDEVILAGVPLDDARTYAPAYEAVSRHANRPPSHDFDTHYASPDSVEHWRQCIRNFTEDGRADGITSVSGWTLEWLGSPR